MTSLHLDKPIVPDPKFRKLVETKSGEKVSACYQCQKCTNGCPLTFAMDISPHKIIRSVHFGLKEEALNSDTIWVCASCETCTTRCPNGIDIAQIMDTLRQTAQQENVKSSQSKIPAFHAAFLSSIKRHGRVAEMEMALEYYLRSEGLGSLFKQAGKGLNMLKKGKIKILPEWIKSLGPIKNIFRNAERKN